MTEPASRRSATAMLAEVVAGLSRGEKELSPKFFYDETGSRLFEEITRLPEYYLTRAERGLLEQWVPAWVEELMPRSLVELGAGSAEKSRVVLDAMRAQGGEALYLPVDVSAAFLRETAERLRREYPGLRITPVAADFSEGLELPAIPRPAWFALLGSTIGNFTPDHSVALLRSMAAHLTAGGRVLLGADLVKSPARLHAAYNDAAGVTAEFNRNLLRVLNAELGADFDPEGFEHYAFFHPVAHHVEMHLVSRRPQTVTIPEGGEFPFRAGESIRTEISRKYGQASLERLFDAAGLRLDRWVTDPGGDYALLLAALRS